MDGTILPGIIRDSIINLTRQFFPEVLVREKPTHKDDLLSLYENGLLEEVFVTGTASTIGQVSSLRIGNVDVDLPPNDNGLAAQMKEIIQQIQYGEKPHVYSLVLDKK